MKIARLPIRQGPYWWPSTQANLQMIGKERLQELVDASRRTLGVCANVVLGPSKPRAPYPN
jgi:hypothetical protein